RSGARPEVLIAAASGIELPDLSRLQRAAAGRIDAGFSERLGQRARRGVDRLFGEREGSVVVGEGKLGAAVEERLHGICRVEMLVAHEPAWLIGANRQDRQPKRA